MNYTGSDCVFLCELALYGPFYEIAEPLFFKRYHPGNAYLDWRSCISWFNPAWKGRISFPHWRQFFDFITTIRRVPLPLTERLRCYGTLAHWLILYGRRMIKDLLVAGYMFLHTRQWRSNAKPISIGSSRESDCASPMNMPRLALFGVFGVGNLGNDSTLEAMLSRHSGVSADGAHHLRVWESFLC